MAPNWKPEPHARVKARAKRQAAAERRACEDVCWSRAGDGQTAECECDGCPKCANPGRCARAVWRSHVSYFKVGHVDEKLSKALGGDRTDPQNCRVVCRDCHFSGPSGAHRITRRASL